MALESFLPLLLWLWLSLACAPIWLEQPDYAHGPFVIALAAYFFYQRFRRLTFSPPDGPNLTWVWSLAWVPAIFLLELVRLSPMPWRLSLWLIYLLASITTLVWAWQRHGTRGAQAAFFPMLLASLAVPWPLAWETPLTGTLGSWIAQAAGGLLQLSGIPNQVQGRILELQQGPLGVEEACSGIRSLQAALAISLALGEWFHLTRPRRLLILGVGITTALVLNILRTFLLARGFAGSGPAFLDQWHDLIAGLSMGVLCLALFLSAWIARNRIDPASHPLPIPSGSGLRFPRINQVFGKSIFGVQCAGTLLAWALAQLWYLTAPARTAAPLPDSAFSGSVMRSPIPEPVSGVLQADRADFLLPRADAPTARSGIGYHLYWKNDRGFSLFHRPEVCMPGGGWQLTAPPLSFASRVADRPAWVHAYTFQRDSARLHLYWMVWMDGRPVKISPDSGLPLQLQLLPELILSRQNRVLIEVVALAGPPSPTLPPAEEWEIFRREFGLAPPPGISPNHR